jgi:pimeloyl-ACP methyl ester carboxylesterase
MKYFLIHGYGKSLDLFDSKIPANGGFDIFDEEIAHKEAYPYIWAITVDRKRLSHLNPFAQLQLYYAERKKASSDKELKKLYASLEKNQPKIIIAHSTGARLIMNYLKQHSLPRSVESLVFVQADISEREWQKVALPLRIRFHSFWCWWDQALISSMILNRYLPMGLYSQKPYSRFYPLRMLPNPHQDIWRDEKFKQLLQKEMR